MATIDLKLKSYDELQFEIMRLNTDNYLKQQKIDQLTNNWNELEEWLKIIPKYFMDRRSNNTAVYIQEGMKQQIDLTLDKMKEIKEGKND